ncbi:type 1 fimbrial protein [Salmonella enterica subsp. enterica serovar Saintpaul]|nr:type 1 fimbrial protein [Salmonella enterica]EBX0087336.1 type 1 fimbrial protein [Salmonella enterica subsp. enterica serovar Miami]ECC8720515.1 type 1 fimbrial protein [Salmonella enterica subsp. houtenae]ECT1737363.1 type 1 fimbrial protein [Salmonella enterica subsp. enterica serovar Saintpaul]ECT9565152.1 type 1 fimbrial protein [Salmonella enterica subsp. enterica serovar Newport]
MAGKKVAGTLLLAGLMMSAGAMAASGDPVQGGSGSVSFNVSIVAPSCSVSVPTEVNLDQINKNSMRSGGLVESKSFDTVFSNCKDKTLQMGVQAADIMADGSWAYFDSGDPDGTFFYNIQLPQDSEITGGRNLDVFDVFYLNNSRPVYIKPGSDNYTMSSKVNFYRITNASLANVGSVVSASFTYNISYQ